MSDPTPTASVNSVLVLFPGQCTRIDNEWMIIVSRNALTGPGVLTVARLFTPIDPVLLANLTACAHGQLPTAPTSHAAGAKINQASGVPFEGPFSLIDLPSLSIFTNVPDAFAP